MSALTCCVDHNDQTMHCWLCTSILTLLKRVATITSSDVLHGVTVITVSLYERRKASSHLPLVLHRISTVCDHGGLVFGAKSLNANISGITEISAYGKLGDARAPCKAHVPDCWCYRSVAPSSSSNSHFSLTRGLHGLSHETVLISGMTVFTPFSKTA